MLRPSLSLLCILVISVSSTPDTPSEPINPIVLIKEYSHVFKVKGNPIVVSRAGVVVAAEDRLRTLLHLPPDHPPDLFTVRNMTQTELVRLLFYAVAGAYATDPRAQCPFLMDADTGALEPATENSENEGVLVGMCITLLCILGIILLSPKEHTGS